MTSATTRIGYNLLRSLARKGRRVGVGVDAHSGMAVFSRYCAGSFRHPDYNRDPRGFVAAVKKALVEHRPAVYMPADEDVFVFAEHAEMLRDVPACTVAAPVETLRLLDNKYDSIRLADSLGIPTPATIRPASVEEIVAFAREHPGPLMLKFVRSSASRGVFLLQPERIESALAQIRRHTGKDFGAFIVQEHVQATGYGVSMLFDHGQPKASFAHRRLRERAPTGGPSTLRQSIHHPVLESYAAQLLQQVGFHGVAMVEFKHDEATGKIWFLEINPRWWGSLALAIRAGVDFPDLYCRLALGEKLPRPPDYQTGITVRWLLGDFLALKNQLVYEKKLPAFQSFFPTVDGYDDACADDPLALAAELVLHPAKALLAKLRGGSRPLP